MSGRFRRVAGLAVSLGITYVVACALGFGLLVLGFKVGLLGQIDILFYRGLVLIVFAFLGTFALIVFGLRWLHPHGLGARDAFAAAILSLSLNLSFLVVVPVTVDRSISIFILGQMAAAPGETFTPGSMTALFTQIYVTDHHQIERRLHEQAVSGNVEKDDGGYRISARGKQVVAAARIVAAMFDSHAGILAPSAP